MRAERAQIAEATRGLSSRHNHFGTLLRMESPLPGAAPTLVRNIFADPFAGLAAKDAALPSKVGRTQELLRRPHRFYLTSEAAVTLAEFARGMLAPIDAQDAAIVAAANRGTKTKKTNGGRDGEEQEEQEAEADKAEDEDGLTRVDAAARRNFYNSFLRHCLNKILNSSAWPHCVALSRRWRERTFVCL